MTEEKVDLTEREKVYGEFVDNMERTALIWSGILGTEVKDYHVPLLMMTYKAFRSAQAPRYSDNTDDIEGWRQGLLRVVAKNYGGTIQARDVESYLAQVAAETGWVDQSHDFEAPLHVDPVLEQRIHDLVQQSIEEQIDQEELKESRRPPEKRSYSQVDGRNIEAYLRNRCAAETGSGPCMLNTNHDGYCVPTNLLLGARDARP